MSLTNRTNVRIIRSDNFDRGNELMIGGVDGMEYISAEKNETVDYKLLQKSIKAKQLSEEQFRIFIGNLEKSNDSRIQEYIEWIKQVREG